MNGIKLFMRVGGAILLAAALGRFLLAAGTSPVLALPEPFIGISIRTAVVQSFAFGGHNAALLLKAAA